VTDPAASLIDRLRRAGATLTCSPHGGVRFSAPAPLPVDLLAEARQHRDAIARALAGGSDPGELPGGPCPGCGGGTFWRASSLSGGPGPWHCERCAPPDPAEWIDGCAVPSGGHGSGMVGWRA
jgi:hypothetical protein